MLLGELIARFEDSDAAEDAVLAMGDLVLLGALRAEAEARGLAVGEVMAEATRRYASEASDEEWLTLIGAMGRGDDPGAVFLRRALAHLHQVASPR